VVCGRQDFVAQIACCLPMGANGLVQGEDILAPMGEGKPRSRWPVFQIGQVGVGQRDNRAVSTGEVSDCSTLAIDAKSSL
jgi:hypothetical protein